jgi:hypothetical protein
MTEAFLMLKNKNINELVPKVKINLAMISDSARNINDVASFSNGFIIIDDKIDAISSVRFGKSKHLASLLLYLNEKIGARAILNVKLNLSVINKLNYSELTKDFKLKEEKKVDVLLHKGDFGIEPCAYIIGENAKDVADKVLNLIG